MGSRSFSDAVMSWVLAIAACAMPANCAAQTSGLPREVLLLSRIRRNVQSELAHLPNYTCLATIERSTRTQTSPSSHLVDTLRVEVAHVGDKELFSMPGTNRFEEQLPSQIADSGLASTGEFALHLKSAFGGASTITWHGEEDLDGRRALRYDFGIPSFYSSWTIRVGAASGDVGASGSFWVDAQSLELLRLETHAERLPANLPVLAAVSRIDYGKVRIGSSDVVLPQTAQLALTDLTGEEHQNSVEFSHCRQYSAGSEITFGEPAPEAVPSMRPSTEIPIPDGLGLRVELETEIDLAKAKVGDLITARVSAVTGKPDLRVVPKGALLKGRIRWLQKGSRPLDPTLVALEFSELEFGGKRGQFFGQLRSVDKLPGLVRLPASSTAEMSGNTAQALLSIATFRISGGRSKLPEGLGMLWQTEDPSR